MATIYFEGGGFATAVYWKTIMRLVGGNAMPAYYAGSSAGSCFALVARALATVPDMDRRCQLASDAFYRALPVMTTQVPLRELVDTMVALAVELAMHIQPDISRYCGYLCITKTHLASWVSVNCLRWDTWDDLVHDLRQGGSLPLLNDHLPQESFSDIYVDGSLRKWIPPKGWEACIHRVSPLYNRNADECPPRDNSPSFRHMLLAPSLETLRKWIHFPPQDFSNHSANASLDSHSATYE